MSINQLLKLSVFKYAYFSITGLEILKILIKYLLLRVYNT